MRSMRRTGFPGLTLLALATVASAQARIPPIAPAVHDIRPGAGWTVKALSDYDTGVAKTPGDTPVYIFESGKAGGRSRVGRVEPETTPVALLRFGDPSE